MKRLLIIIMILYTGSIFSRNIDLRPLLCETNLINQKQFITIERVASLDSLFGLDYPSIRFVFLSDDLSPHEVDNFIENKKYGKYILASNHPIWITKRDIVKNKSFTILLSQRNIQNSRYVHQLFYVRNLSEKLPDSLSYKSFIVYRKQPQVADTTFYSAFIQFWKKNLRPVHIILTDDNDNHTKLKSLIADQYRVFGSFIYQNKPIRNVRVNSGIKSQSGYFSLPFDKFIRILPQRPGYSFEPSCIASNFESTEFERKTIAFPLKPEEKKIAEANATNMDQLQLYEVNVVDFNTKKSVFSFQKPTSQISLKNSSNNHDCNEFSISFWIYPTSDSKFQNIISQDTIFNIKLFNGYYCFTRVGVLDYQLTKTPVLFNKWSFMSFVVEENTLTAYCNGTITQKIHIAPLALANRNFQIGNNIWDEHFRGYLSSVSIWERSLSNEEVLQLYKAPASITNYSLIIASSTVIFFIICLLLYLKQKAKKQIEASDKPTNSLTHHHIRQIETNQSNIQFIGNLHLWNENKEDISLLMSSKQKHLFCLLALYTFENEIGISSTEINNILWPLMDTKSANNNRNVYLMRLKELLQKFPDVRIEFQQKHWKVLISENISCDYIKILNIEQELKNKNYQRLSEYLKLINNGLLVNIQDAWIDKFKSNFEDARLLTLEILLNEIAEIGNYEQSIQIANAMLSLDEFNEFAFNHKICALNNSGKKSIANKHMQIYKARYNEIYGE